MSYQGWKNWETWNVSLWVNNDEGTYRAMRRARPFTADSAEELCRDMFPDGTPDMHSSGQSDEKDEGLDVVDWEEIAADFNAE